MSTYSESTGGLKAWTALPRSFPMGTPGIAERACVPARVEKALEERATMERNRAPPQPALTEAEDLEHFLREGRRKQAEKYLDTQLVAFRFEGELDPDPRQAPLVSFHPMREVVHALEEETYAFRPDAVFGFLREALSRFPSRLPEEDAYHGPLNDDDYDERVQACLASLVAAVASERPSEPFEFLDGWLDARATEEAAERDAPQPSLEQRAESVDVRDMSEDEFGKFAMDVFTRFDKDKNGVLDVWEFKEVLKSSALDFSKAEIRHIVAECDADGNGNIDYREFVPIFYELTSAIRSKADAREAHDAEVDAKRSALELAFVRGMTRGELDATFRRVFDAADADGNGVLDPSEFLAALHSADLGLSKKEINALLSESDVNEDGVVEYEEFVPLCFEVLVERAKNKQLESDALASPDAITRLLLDVFVAADEAGRGSLTVRQIKSCLRYLVAEDELALSPAQIVSVVAECEVSHDDGTVKYARFAPVAADVIHGMLDFDAQRKRVDAIQLLADEHTNVGSLRDKTPEEVEAFLLEAFAEADADDSGGLDDVEMLAVLRSVGADRLGLTERQIAGIIAAADVDKDGVVDYAELSSLVHDTVMQLEREVFIRGKAFRNTQAEIKSREEIIATVDDTLGAAVASQSTEDTSHLRGVPDFEGGRAGRRTTLAAAKSVRMFVGSDYLGGRLDNPMVSRRKY